MTNERETMAAKLVELETRLQALEEPLKGVSEVAAPVADAPVESSTAPAS